MNRYITLDVNKKVSGVRFANEIVIGEIKSDVGEMGQIHQLDGSFINDTTPIIPPVIQPTNAEINDNLVAVMSAIFDLYMK